MLTSCPDIGGDNSGYGEDRTLPFSARLEKLIQLLTRDKDIAMDVIEGRGVTALVKSPEKYQRRKRDNKKSNDTKQDLQEKGKKFEEQHAKQSAPLMPEQELPQELEGYQADTEPWSPAPAQQPQLLLSARVSHAHPSAEPCPVLSGHANAAEHQKPDRELTEEELECALQHAISHGDAGCSTDVGLGSVGLSHGDDSNMCDDWLTDRYK